MAVENIFFIDDRVEDKEALFSALDASAKWFVLDSSLDGINQMQKILSSYRSLDSIHIISHGSTGAINIGNSVLNSTTLANYQTQLQDIGASLIETGDLLLYGCDVAKGDEGQKFINDLAKVTGTNVAASEDPTGITSLAVNLVNILPEFDAAESNFGIDANNDGIIGALTSIDSSGSVSLSVDSVGNIFAGNVAVKTYSSEQIHTGIYGTEWTALAAETIGDVNTILWKHESGALHTWQADENWQWVNSDGWWGFGSAEFDAAESNFGIDANNDGIIGALSSIELNVSKATGEEIVPVICICWREEDLNQAGTHYFDADLSVSGAAVEITILGVQTHPTVAYSDFAVIA